MKTRPSLAARTALALATLALFGAAAPKVQALGVGRLTVQSALGEGMRAEIDISSLTPDEAASLAVRIASPEAYRAAGVDYNLVLAGTQVAVVRRDDGRSVLRLSSSRAVQEPFIELIVELSWASGRLVREFTLLFDPPGSRPAPPVQAAAAVAPLMAAAPGPTAAPAVPPAVSRPLPRPPAAPVAGPAAAPAAGLAAAPAAGPAAAPVAAAPGPRLPRSVARAAAAAPNTTSAPRAAAPLANRAQAVATGAGQYAVVSGDTLYRVAGRTRPAGVSLDQMLVGLYRANPDAFIENNVNKLRAGAVLSLPSADDVRDVTSSDMRRLIEAQSVDFGAYRNRLAQGAPLAQAQESGRTAQGKVQAEVDDRKQSGAASPDKLKLSGGAASASEAQIALAAERRENAERVADLTRNVEELKRLLQGSTSASTPVVTALPADVGGAAPRPAASAVVAAPASAAVAAVPVATAAASRPAAMTPAVLPAPAVEPAGSFIDGLSASPWLLPGGALALLLAGAAAWQLRSRMRKAASETSFLESRMQPDSFFGASGGQHVDTRDASRTSASSMGYSLSQLDAIGDVDPVAEADVYLAYGRDLQAEEILKEALRTTPERMAVRTKLLEVYAKRRDSKGFELLATQLYALTRGVGPDWAKAQELGLQFDTDNPLYQPGGEPEAVVLDGERVMVEPLGATTQPHSIFAPVTQQPEDSRLPQFGATGFGLDLDLGQPDPDRTMDATRPMVSGAQRPVDPGLDFDFEDRSLPAERPGTPPVKVAPRSGETQFDSMTLDLDDGKGAATVVGGPDSLLDFGSFPMSESGSLADSALTAPGHLGGAASDQADPLARKLELAEEFRQIGDIDGARDLLEEVVSKAAGALRIKAQTMLDALA